MGKAIKIYLKKILKKKGIKISRFPNTQELQLSNPTHAIYCNLEENSRAVFEVNVEHCVNIYGFSYSTNKFHPFVTTLQEYEGYKRMEYENSILKRFYDNFQPKT